MNTRLLLRIFFRTYLVGAAFNTRGLQNVGISFVMDPGLQAIYKEKALQRARKRYLALYNTHPFWTPMQAGIFLFLEQKIARGLLPEKILLQLRTTLTYTLSAVGDSFLSGSFFIFWSLLSIFFIQYSSYAGLFIFWGSCFLGLQAIKIYTFYLGISQGLDCLRRLQLWDLINWGQRLKYMNACLIVVLWYLFFPLDVARHVLLTCALGLSLSVWVIHIFPRIREILLFCLLFLYYGAERILSLLEFAG